MIEIRASRAGEIARQKELWKLAFGDEDSYIDYYYNHYYTPDHVLVLAEDGIIQTMLTLFPTTLVNPAGETASAFYIYALATDPKARKKGFGRELVHYLDFYLSERGVDCLTVVPAVPGLHKFFHTAGFDECFATRKTEVLAERLTPPPEDASAAPVEPKRYHTIRSGLLEGTHYVDYDDSLFEYQRGLDCMEGGDLYRVVVDGVEGCASAEYEEDSLVLKELLIPQPQMAGALAAIAQVLPAVRYHVRTPAFWFGLPGSYVQEFGMAKWYNQEKQVAWNRSTNGHMGLAFD